MQKHIEKIENISYTPSFNCYTIVNLSIDNFGNFNLFSGKRENGYKNILSSIRYEHNSYNKNVIFRNDLFANIHFTDLKASFRKYFLSTEQIFATTQRYDVIQAFAEVAKEYGDVEAYYYRLGRSARNSNKGQSIVTMHDIDGLINYTKQNIEVR